MATTKRKAPAPTVPPFPLGDPTGAVRWTPQMLKKVLPRRELGLEPPTVDAPEALAADLRAAAHAWMPSFERGASAPGADASLYGLLREALAWLDAGAVVQPSLDVAALAYQFAAPGDHFRSERFTALMVDLWVQRFGLTFALEALAAAFDVAFAMSHDCEVVTFPARGHRRGYGAQGPMAVSYGDLTLVRAAHNELLHFRPEEIAELARRTLALTSNNDECEAWIRLRAHLAAAPQEVWESTLPSAEALLAHPSALVRHLVAFAYPERPAWAESLASEQGHAVHPILTAAVRDPAVLPYKMLGYFYEYFDESAVSMLAASGPRAVPALLDAASTARAKPVTRLLLGLVAQVDTDEAVQGALSLASKPGAEAAVAAMRANFPGRVAAVEAKRGR